MLKSIYNRHLGDSPFIFQIFNSNTRLKSKTSMLWSLIQKLIFSCCMHSYLILMKLRPLRIIMNNSSDKVIIINLIENLKNDWATLIEYDLRLPSLFELRPNFCLRLKEILEEELQIKFMYWFSWIRTDKIN